MLTLHAKTNKGAVAKSIALAVSLSAYAQATTTDVALKQHSAPQPGGFNNTVNFSGVVPANIGILHQSVRLDSSKDLILAMQTTGFQPQLNLMIKDTSSFSQPIWWGYADASTLSQNPLNFCLNGEQLCIGSAPMGISNTQIKFSDSHNGSNAYTLEFGGLRVPSMPGQPLNAQLSYMAPSSMPDVPGTAISITPGGKWAVKGQNGLTKELPLDLTGTQGQDVSDALKSLLLKDASSVMGFSDRVKVSVTL
jgi:hypothetical protein